MNYFKLKAFSLRNSLIFSFEEGETEKSEVLNSSFARYSWSVTVGGHEKYISKCLFHSNKSVRIHVTTSQAASTSFVHVIFTICDFTFGMKYYLSQLKYSFFLTNVLFELLTMLNIAYVCYVFRNYKWWFRIQLLNQQRYTVDHYSQGYLLWDTFTTVTNE